VVPLIRTPDRYRANADPLDYNLWPCDRRALVDDLWSLALAHLAEMPAYEARVGEQAALVGRDLEPWRAILAVALWLDDHGVTGLATLIEALAKAYQAERPDLEMGDLTTLAVRGLLRCAVSAVSPANDVKRQIPRALTLTTSSITRACKELVNELELDMDPENVSVQRVGRVLGKMRWGAERTTRAKGWTITLAEPQRWALAYGVAWPQQLVASEGAPLPGNGIGSLNGITAQGAEGPSCENSGSLSPQQIDFEWGEI
jgi:hypothetical protein